MGTLNKMVTSVALACVVFSAGAFAQWQVSETNVVKYGSVALVDPKAKDIKIITINFPNANKGPVWPKHAKGHTFEKALKLHNKNMAKQARLKGPMNVSPQERKMKAQQEAYFRNSTFEMQQRGFVTVPNEDLSYINDTVRHQFNDANFKKPEEVINKIAFDSVIFSGSLDLKHVKAVGGGTDQDGRYRSLTSLISYPGLQNIRVELHEMPLHDPDFGVESFTGPEFELMVNGKLGATYLIVLTDNVLARFELDKAITATDPEYKSLMALAEQLF